MVKRVLVSVLKLRILTWEIILDYLGGHRRVVFKREAAISE